MNTGAGRKLGRPTGHRFAMMKNMATSLLHHEKIKTTLPKAREVARFTDRIITAAKGEGLNARRKVARDIANASVRTKLFDVIAPRYKTRQGGYTQFIRLGARMSDGAEMGILKLVQ